MTCQFRRGKIMGNWIRKRVHAKRSNNIQPNASAFVWTRRWTVSCEIIILAANFTVLQAHSSVFCVDACNKILQKIANSKVFNQFVSLQKLKKVYTFFNGRWIFSAEKIKFYYSFWTVFLFALLWILEIRLGVFLLIPCKRSALNVTLRLWCFFNHFRSCSCFILNFCVKRVWLRLENCHNPSKVVTIL